MEKLKSYFIYFIYYLYYIITYLYFFSLVDHVRCHNVPSIPRPVERGPAEVGREHGAIPSSPLLHARICSTHCQRKRQVSIIDSSGTHAANVRCQGIPNQGARVVARNVPFVSIP